jgi:hypothetical protein
MTVIGKMLQWWDAYQQFRRAMHWYRHSRVSWAEANRKAIDGKHQAEEDL